MRSALAVLSALLLSGCSSLGYYWQAVSGHLSLMQAARPVEDWLQDERSSEALRQRLALASRIRHFAVHELHLPDSRSYQSYVHLQRPAVVWNVVAAPELSLQPKRWCFPVAGCVSYKGFFNEAMAQQQAQVLRAQGLDVAVLPVPAYSTLGWLNWAGGDPLLSTFLGYPEPDLARLIFHELAHQVVYVSSDTAFNESFATAVERLGTAQWLAQASEDTRRGQEIEDARRQRFRAQALALRRELAALYGERIGSQDASDRSAQQAGADQPVRTPAERERLLRLKREAFERFAQRHAQNRADAGAHAGQDAWVRRLNNASLAALADYEDLTPAFEALFHQAGSWPRFLAQVRQLAALPRRDRQAVLARLGAQPAATASAVLP